MKRIQRRERQRIIFNAILKKMGREGSINRGMSKRRGGEAAMSKT